MPGEAVINDLISPAKCPKCAGARFKRWSELDDEQKILVKKLPASAEFSLEHRKLHSSWCTRCFYEMMPEPGNFAAV